MSSSMSASSNASSDRIYDLEYMMKLAASSASAMSSTSTFAQLNSQEDVAEIIKVDSSNSNSSYESSDYDEYDEDDEEEEEYGSWYDIRTDLTDEQLDELRTAVYDAISLTLPLSPASEVVPLPPLSLSLPQQNPPTLVQQQSSYYPAPIVRTTGAAKFAPPVQFQSRAFATLATKRQTRSSTQRQSQFQSQIKAGVTASKAFNAFNAPNPSNAFNWRREVPRIQNSHIRSNGNRNGNGNANGPLPLRSGANTVSSWRRTQPGTEWKWNEETSNYTLIKV